MYTSWGITTQPESAPEKYLREIQRAKKTFWGHTTSGTQVIAGFMYAITLS